MVAKVRSRVKLLQRRTRIEDLPACADLLGKRLIGLKSDLLLMWERLLVSSSATSVVIEQIDQGENDIVGFGFGIFVSDSFVAECSVESQTYLLQKLIEAWQVDQGDILNLTGIRLFNQQDGLNLVGLHTIWGKEGMNDGDCAPIRDLMLDSLFKTHRGYNIKSFMKEVYGQEEMLRHKVFGLRIMHDYSAGHALMAISRGQALKATEEGKFIRELFRYNKPICSFTPADQELLQLAVEGMNEADIASILGISKDSVKSRWNSIYNHIPRQLDHELFDGKKAAYKSRFLLQWLRSHPEELKPNVFFRL